MGSGKSLLSAATGGLLGAHQAAQAQNQALMVQMMQQQQALEVQKQAQQRALAEQERANAAASQQAERAAKEYARVNTDVKERRNSADLTKGMVKIPKTAEHTLGNGDSLGLEDKDEVWY